MRTADSVIDNHSAKKPKDVSEIAGDQWTITLPKTRICTEKQLIDAYQIDTRIWEIKRLTITKWEMAGFPRPVGTSKSWVQESTEPIVTPLYGVRCVLEKRRVVESAIAELELLRIKAKDYSPTYPKVALRKITKTDNMVEFSLSDHHFGSSIWGKETGGDNYDLKIAKKDWEGAFGSLIPRVEGFQPGKALLVLGNDQHNSDNRAGTTENGTRMDMDSRYQKVFAISRDCSIWAIEVLLEKYGSVDVVMCGGNHDPLGCWHLGDSLKSWFRKCAAVNINNEPLFRKYYEHGTSMIMHTHGHKGKLEDYGKIMAAEQPAMWGRTRWREAHTGDKHHRRLIEQPGFTVRILPSLRPPDAWSAESQFVGSLRAAEAYVWNKSEGLIGTGVHSILMK